MKQIALEKLIKGHQEIFGDLFLNLEQQEKLTKLYDECFELQKQQIIDAYKDGVVGTKLAEQYYNETFKNK